MRILVVEDEKKISAFIKRGLKEEGYSVDCAFDGQEGFDMVQNTEYDLVLLDIMIPRIDGVTLCKKIRSEKFVKPILILTAKDTVNDKVCGLDAGADDYLTKPFAFEELLARIRALLRKKDFLLTATVLKVADLEMDLVNHTVSRSGHVVELTVKEYALLEYLLRRKGTVVTRTMIAEHVWDIDFDTATNIIEVYINYLRNKIDKDFEKKLITTVRGRGYLIKE